MRIDPPPSDPGAKGSIPDATAAAAPPLEPPAPSEGFHGFRVGGPASPSVYDGRPNSGVALLPRLTAPAASTASTSSSESSGTKSVNAREPNRAGTPARRCRSLSARGMPHSGRGGRHVLLDMARPRDRRFGRHRGEGADLAVEPRDPVEEVLRQLDRRHLATLQQLVELEGGVLVQLGHPPSLRAMPRGIRWAT